MSVEVRELRKSYGSQVVLDGINFSIGAGEIVAFLGNNGAGKSTTMKIINGYLSKDSGDVRVCGYDVDKSPVEVHRMIGYLPEHNPVYPDMYVKEYLHFIAGMYGLKGGKKSSKVDEMVERTGLTKEYKKRIGMLSKGYRQRVGLASALIPDPKVLILDEPTTGLDPNQIVEVRNLIKEVGKDKSVMLSTHIMQEVSAICDRVIIINKGKIVANEAESEIVHSASGEGDYMCIEVEFAEDLQEGRIRDAFADSIVEGDGARRYVIRSREDIRSEVFAFAVREGLTLLTLRLREASMEEIFRKVTQKA